MWTTVLAITLAVATPAAAQNDSTGAGNCRQVLSEALDLMPVNELDEAEQAALYYLREEEKLARDVYVTLSLSWNMPIFGKIARAEQRHMDLVGLLLTRHELVDPVIDDGVGQFSDPDLRALFTELTDRGRLSLIDALVVGATIEDLDLADLTDLIDVSDEADMDLIAENLAVGTRNHMRAFAGRLEAAGSIYEPQYIDQATFDAIINSERQRGIVVDEYGDILAECGPGTDGTGNRCSRCGGTCDGSGQNDQSGSGGRGNRGGGNGGGGGQATGGSCDGSGPNGPSGSGGGTGGGGQGEQ